MPRNRKSVYRSKTTGAEKVIITTMIPRELYEKVTAAATRIYGIQRGALSKAIEEALELWLAVHTQPRTQPNPRLPLRERYNAFIDCIERELGVVPITLHQFLAERCISNTFKIKDQRSIYGWLHRFYLAGLIKPLTIPKIYKPGGWARNKSIELVARRA